MNDQNMIKLTTRIAPSPTGDMHIGTARTAYFNWLAARATGGTFILRIDDTDLERSDPRFTEVILETMDWLGLNYDKLVYQSQRFDRYKEVARQLIHKGQAEVHDGAIIFFPGYFINNGVDAKTNKPESNWTDEIAGKVVISLDDQARIYQGMVIIKSDGSPTYHFASVVDDIDFGVNYIIRGKDHTTNTAKHIAIYNSLEAPVPKFAHIGLINKDGSKLSKRDGAASMLWYKNQGYDPDAVLNFMVRLGWGPTVDDKTTAILPREKMVEIFLEGGHMKNSDANMDLIKLDSFDRKYKGRKKNGQDQSGN